MGGIIWMICIVGHAQLINHFNFASISFSGFYAGILICLEHVLPNITEVWHCAVLWLVAGAIQAGFGHLIIQGFLPKNREQLTTGMRICWVAYELIWGPYLLYTLLLMQFTGIDSASWNFIRKQAQIHHTLNRVETQKNKWARLMTMYQIYRPHSVNR